MSDEARQPGQAGWLALVRVAATVLVLVAVAGLAGIVSVRAIRDDAPDDDALEVSVAFGETDGLPDVLVPATDYTARLTIEWTGPNSFSDRRVGVYVSRLGNTTEDAPADGWPRLTCASDDIADVRLLTCPFTSAGPGEFALNVEVFDDGDEKIGEWIYTHVIVDPATTTTD